MSDRGAVPARPARRGRPRVLSSPRVDEVGLRSAGGASDAGLLTWADGAALLAVLVWGANFPVLKLIMTAIDPLPMMFLRAAVSSVVLALILVGSGRWRVPAPHEARPLVLVSLVGFTLNQLLYSYGLHLTTASHSGLIFTLTPLFVFVLSHWLGHVKIAGLDLVGLVLGIAGAALILGVPIVAGEWAGGAVLLGDLLTVGAAITWGVWTILAAPILRRHGTLLGTAWITMAGSIGLLPLAVPGLVSQDWGRVPWVAFAGLAYAATVAGALGSLLWYAAVRRIGAARTAIYANMESFFAVVAAAVMLGERVAWTSLVGGAAIVAGVLLTRRTG